MNSTIKLGGAPNYFIDAGRFAVAPIKPENVVLNQYGFVGYVRAGLAAGLANEPEGNRGNVTASVNVMGDSGDSNAIEWSMTLLGPGDVAGFDLSQVIRRFPAAGSTDIDVTFLAHIEFDRPELPWLFSPHPVKDGHLVPWIALVVVEANKARLQAGPEGLPQQLVTDTSELPNPEDCWAFAHAQVMGSTDGTDLKTRLSDAHGAQNLSRLICPRRLRPGISYIACVGPLFRAGAQAGTGNAIDENELGD